MKIETHIYSTGYSNSVRCTIVFYDRGGNTTIMTQMTKDTPLHIASTLLPKWPHDFQVEKDELVQLIAFMIVMAAKGNDHFYLTDREIKDFIKSRRKR